MYIESSNRIKFVYPENVSRKYRRKARGADSKQKTLRTHRQGTLKTS